MNLYLKPFFLEKQRFLEDFIDKLNWYRFTFFKNDSVVALMQVWWHCLKRQCDLVTWRK